MKISLGNQIACVRREIALRKSVYPGLCGKEKMKRSEAEYEVACMEANLATLLWLQRNEAAIRGAVGQATGGVDA